MTDFISRDGGDGFQMFPDEILNITTVAGDTGNFSLHPNKNNNPNSNQNLFFRDYLFFILDIIQRFVSKKSPISFKKDHRITVIQSSFERITANIYLLFIMLIPSL